jgi:transcriptional regulator of NAD metabolism
MEREKRREKIVKKLSQSGCTNIISLKKLANHVIKSNVISGKNIGGIISIPKMEITPIQSP